jgi:hypothetical protein
MKNPDWKLAITALTVMEKDLVEIRKKIIDLSLLSKEIELANYFLPMERSLVKTSLRFILCKRMLQFMSSGESFNDGAYSVEADKWKVFSAGGTNDKES